MSLGNETTSPVATPSPDTAADLHALQIRLWITVGCGSISICAGAAMFVAYRRYRNHFANHYNDLYVMGIGGLQFLQSIQMVLFAGIHLFQLGDFSSIACIVNAVLQQFLNFGGQIFAMGFMVSLLTLRARCSCCWQSSIVVDVETMPRGSGADLSNHSPLSSPRAARTNTTRVQRRAWCSSDRMIARTLWPLLALTGAIVSTVVMCLVVIQDPDQQPHAGAEDPTNFEVNFGWCWIPVNHPQLRWYCSYMLSALTFMLGIASLCYLLCNEHIFTLKMHASVYLRLAALCFYVAVAYLVGGISLFTDDPTITLHAGYIATAVFALNEAFVAFVFLLSERAVLAFFRGDAHVPGNGFSNSVNHLLMMTVVGIPLPSTVNDFTRDPLQPLDSSHLALDDNPGNEVSDSIMSTRRLLHEHSAEYRIDQMASQSSDKRNKGGSAQRLARGGVPSYGVS